MQFRNVLGQPSTIFGCFIFASNVYFHKYSPVYYQNKDNSVNNPTLKFIQILMISGLKGCLYGITFPLSPLVIAFDSFDGSYQKHFIPGSVHLRRN